MNAATAAGEGRTSPLGRLGHPAELWLVLIVVATRLPFISVGYGRDGDAWLTMVAASHIAATGHYVASRLPGFPVVEYAYAALPWKTPLWTNGLTVVMSALAAVLVYRLARELRCRYPFLLALAFVMTPAVYVASAASMDYLYALAFALASLLLAMRHRPLASGVLLGLATGARATSVLFALALVPLLVTTPSGRRLRIGLMYIVGLLVAAALVWWPVFATYGTGFLTYYVQPRGMLQTIAHGTVHIWGLLGLLGLAVAFILEARGGFGRVRERLGRSAREERWWLRVLAALVLAELAVFARLPDEAAYLIPVVPLVLLLVGRLAGKRTVALVCLCLVAAPFVLNLDDYDFSREGQDIRLTVAGPIFLDHDQRLFFRSQAEQQLTLARTLRNGDVLLAGYWGPYGRGLAAVSGEPVLAARILDGLPAAQVRQIQGRGDIVYYLPSAAQGLRDAWGLDVTALGLKHLAPP